MSKLDTKTRGPLDYRYKTIPSLLRDGHIKSFPQIFKFIPKTVVYKDLGVNFNRFNRAVLNPSNLTLQELFTISKLTGLDERQLLDMAYSQTLIARKGKRKK